MHDDEVFRSTNTTILQQQGPNEPPPSGGLVGLIETLGGAPDVVGSVVRRDRDFTIWDVYGARGDVFVHVHGYRAAPDWAGSKGDREAKATEIRTVGRRISDLRSVSAEDLVPVAPVQGWVRECTARWVLTFNDGATVELDERLRVDGKFLAPVAMYVRDQFNGADRSVS